MPREGWQRPGCGNAVTEYRYDNLGRLVEEIGYAQRWTNSPVPWPERAQDLIVKASSADRHSYTFYTDDGKVRGTLDAGRSLHGTCL